MQTAAENKATPVWRRWTVLRLLLIALLGELGIAILNASAMPVFLRYDRGFHEDLVGVVLAAFLISEAAFKPFAGHWADKHGRRLFLILGPAIFIFTPILTIAVPSGSPYFEEGAFIGLRIFDGIAAALLWPAMYAAVGEAVASKERGQAMGLLNVCFMLGLALGWPAGGIVNDVFQSYHASFYLASVVFIMTAGAAYFFAPRKIKPLAGEVDHGAEMKLSDMWKCMGRIPLVMLLGFVAFLSVGFPAPIIKLFALAEFHLSETKVGMAVLLAALAAAAVSSYLGALGERIGREKAVRLGLLLCALGAWPIGAGYWFEDFRLPGVVLFGALLIGLGFLLAIPAWYSSVSHIDEKRSGSYLGAVMTAQGIGAIFGVMVGGKLYRSDHYAPFLACAIGVSFGWLVSIFVLGPKDAKSAESQP